MKTFLKLFQSFLLMCGVFAAETDEAKTVVEGDSVTLNPDIAQIQGFIQVLWRFGDKGPVIAQIDGNDTSYSNVKIFIDRLQLNPTGSLTIKNMRTNHSGLYQLEIDHRTGTLYKKFSVTVYESPSVIEAGQAEMKIMSVIEGNPVTLDVPQLHGNELIVWRCGNEGKLLAKHDIEAKSLPLYETDEKLRDSLKLDHQTGSLIITNTRTTDSGLYTVKISSNKQTLYKRFTVTVSAVPDPGLSPGAVAGIVVVVALLMSAAAAGVIYCCLPRTSKLPNQTLRVRKEETVTLVPKTKIQTGDLIQWLFPDEDTLIAEIKAKTGEFIFKDNDWRFNGRLKLDNETGSLTINNSRAQHSGIYTLKISRRRETLYKTFFVHVEESKIEVAKGDSVTLNHALEINKDDWIQWQFDNEIEKNLIAEIKTRKIIKYGGPDGTFRDRLELNKETGSLTIKNTTTEHTGFYTLWTIRGGEHTLHKSFFISVNESMKAVMEGESVTLEPATKISKVDSIKWLYGDEEQQTLIAEIEGQTGEIFTYGYAADGRFRDSLELDKMTGSLTIKNTRTAHSGPYNLQIRSSGWPSYQTFSVTVKDKVEEILLKENSVTLNPDTEVERDDQILWMFGGQDNLIAQMKGGTVETYDERFRGRLVLDKTTGSLTIRNIEAEHTGLYKLQTISSSRGTLCKKFRVSIPCAAVTNEAREKSLMKKKNDSTGKRVNDSVTEVKPLLNREDVDVVNEQVGTSSV